MLGRRSVALATLVVALAASCHRPRAATPQAATGLYAQALAQDNPKLAYALLARAVQARTPYAAFAARWAALRAEREAQLQALTTARAPAVAPGALTRVATVTTMPPAAPGSPAAAGAGRQAQRSTFVKHGAYWYAETPLLSATYYGTPDAAVAALAQALATPQVQSLVGVWSAQRRMELMQQWAIVERGLAQALAAGTQANLLGEDRAQFTFYAGDLWFLIALVRENGQWGIDNIYSDAGVYPIP